MTTTYAYDVFGGLPLLLGDRQQRYVQGAAGAGNPLVPHADGLGSVRALTDAGGSVVQTYETDEFGVPGLSQGTRAQRSGTPGSSGTRRRGSSTCGRGCTIPRSAGSCSATPSRAL